MIISHTHKFIFIKSLKTAGTSIETGLSTFCSGEDMVTPLNDYRHNRDEKGEFLHKAMNYEGFENLQHAEAQTVKDMVGPEVWNSYFKFSICRNPWDRAISDFFWVTRNDPEVKPKKRFYNYLGVPFDEMGQLRKYFADFLKKSRLRSNDPFYVIDDELCVDDIIRYENLTDDFNRILDKLGLTHADLPRLKGGIRAGGYHYSEYYDEETKKMVADQSKNDIRFFGYKFESK